MKLTNNSLNENLNLSFVFKNNWKKVSFIDVLNGFYSRNNNYLAFNPVSHQLSFRNMNRDSSFC